MVAFTRILHRTTDDALSNKLPTFRANPLHPGACRGCRSRHRGSTWHARASQRLPRCSGKDHAFIPCCATCAECDGWCEYPVADRPNAVRQFLLAAKADPSLIKVRAAAAACSRCGRRAVQWWQWRQLRGGTAPAAAERRRAMVELGGL